MIQTTNCIRCGVRCRKKQGSDNAKLLRHTTSDIGYCVNCGTTSFLMSLDVISSSGRGAKPFDPECLRLPHIQEQFIAVMAAGKADARPDEIDWLEVIANWHLPFPEKRGHRRMF